mmetsp:Transcript_28013/g.70960  ORF Transcript_28013/g.70960 Transcript_28013/m.70960 type:complete len:370 (-) Transcript_28013:8634-9743(-)
MAASFSSSTGFQLCGKYLLSFNFKQGPTISSGLSERSSNRHRLCFWAIDRRRSPRVFSESVVVRILVPFFLQGTFLCASGSRRAQQEASLARSLSIRVLSTAVASAWASNPSPSTSTGWKLTCVRPRTCASAENAPHWMLKLDFTSCVRSKRDRTRVAVREGFVPTPFENEAALPGVDEAADSVVNWSFRPSASLASRSCFPRNFRTIFASAPATCSRLAYSPPPSLRHASTSSSRSLSSTVQSLSFAPKTIGALQNRFSKKSDVTTRRPLMSYNAVCCPHVVPLPVWCKKTEMHTSFCRASSAYLRSDRMQARCPSDLPSRCVSDASLLSLLALLPAASNFWSRTNWLSSSTQTGLRPAVRRKPRGAE